MPCPDTEFRILGALEVIEDGRKLPLRGKMLHALLAALLVRPRQAITADQLIDDLWGEHAPRAARMSLHNLVSTLRRTLRPELLETMNAGYLLRIEADQLDAFHFERLVASAAAERARERVRILAEALSLWRGSPLVDVRYESFAQAEIRRLEELHIHALEERLAAELELGALRRDRARAQRARLPVPVSRASPGSADGRSPPLGTLDRSAGELRGLAASARGDLGARAERSDAASQ